MSMFQKVLVKFDVARFVEKFTPKECIERCLTIIYSGVINKGILQLMETLTSLILQFEYSISCLKFPCCCIFFFIYSTYYPNLPLITITIILLLFSPPFRFLFSFFFSLFSLFSFFLFPSCSYPPIFILLLILPSSSSYHQFCNWFFFLLAWW